MFSLIHEDFVVDYNIIKKITHVISLFPQVQI